MDNQDSSLDNLVSAFNDVKKDTITKFLEFLKTQDMEIGERYDRDDILLPVEAIESGRIERLIEEFVNGETEQSKKNMFAGLTGLAK